jgi:hypothetical protein
MNSFGMSFVCTDYVQEMHISGYHAGKVIYFLLEKIYHKFAQVLECSISNFAENGQNFLFPHVLHYLHRKVYLSCKYVFSEYI